MTVVISEREISIFRDPLLLYSGYCYFCYVPLLTPTTEAAPNKKAALISEGRLITHEYGTSATTCTTAAAQVSQLRKKYPLLRTKVFMYSLLEYLPT